MTGTAFKGSRGLRGMRAEAFGIVRLLLLAFALQILGPAFETLAAPDLAADAALSICSVTGGPSGDHAGAPAPRQDAAPAKPCIFCLPLVGGHALPSADVAALPPPPRVAASPAAAVVALRPAAPPLVFRSRAPPAIAATA